MKTTEQTLKEIEHELPGFHSNKYAILKKWAESIIEECAGSAEWQPNDDKNGHPVLVRQSIIDVINKL